LKKKKSILTNLRHEAQQISTTFKRDHSVHVRFRKETMLVVK